MPSEQEKEDSKIMQEKITNKKLTTWSYMEHILKMSQEDLKSCGFKSIEAGLKYAMENSVKEINKIINEHLKKYPD